MRWSLSTKPRRNIRTTAATKLPDMLDQILEYEAGEMEDTEMVIFFQDLIDTGFAWQLQGHYGRTARSLIASGDCTLPSRR